MVELQRFHDDHGERLYYFDKDRNKLVFPYSDYDEKDLSPDEIEYLDEMFSFRYGETVFLRDYRHDKALLGGYARNRSKSAYSGIKKKDAGFYPNTFLNAKIDASGHTTASHYTNNLFCVRSFAIDIDFRKNPDLKDRDPLSVYQMLEDYDVLSWSHSLPPASYLEFGNQLRIIYVLKNPIHVRQKGGRKALKTVRYIQKRMCEYINSLQDVHADPQPLSSFYRLPGSYNWKGPIQRVCVEKISDERLDFREMMEFEYMPDLPEWYDDWNKKRVVKKKKGNITQIYNTHTLYQTRKAFLEDLATRSDINRYMLLWEWANNEKLYNSPTLEDVYKFNQTLQDPLPEKEIKQKMQWWLRNGRHFKQKNTTIAEKIGIEKEEIMTTREREKLEKIAAGKTRKQLAEAAYQTFKTYREKGLTQKKIAEIMGKHINTIKEYQKRLNAENSM